QCINLMDWSRQWTHPVIIVIYSNAFSRAVEIVIKALILHDSSHSAILSQLEKILLEEMNC
ncbi:MAG: hypothetical protein WCC23_10410, partial [Acinetobacter calcoaceticus]